MNNDMKKIIKRLGGSRMLFVIQACEDITNKDNEIEEMIKLCRHWIKEEENEQIGLFGEIITESVPTRSEEFLLSIKDYSDKELTFIKQLFERAYNDSKKVKYNMICEYIDLIIDLRKQIAITTLNHVNQIPYEEQEHYFKLIPKDIFEVLAHFHEVTVEEMTPKILKKDYEIKYNFRRMRYE